MTDKLGKYLFLLPLYLLILTLISGCNNDKKDENYIQKQALLVNEELEVLIQDDISRITLIASENSKLRSAYQCVSFYYKNTQSLIEEANSIEDSIRFWRLTKSKESKQYGFHSNLDSSLVFSQDKTLRKSALLNNMYQYLKNVQRSYSYCGIMFGTRPARNPRQSNEVYFYGEPYAKSELDLMIMYAEPLSEIPDSLPLWGKLEIMDTTFIPSKERPDNPN